MLRLDTSGSACARRAIMTAVSTVLAHLPGCHAVVLSDYAKGVLTPEVCHSSFYLLAD